MTEIALETRDLTKRYQDFVAVDKLNLTVRSGEVFGLLGPNGAGKTTTILMVLGLTEPTEGKVRLLGLDPVRFPLSVKARVGYLPERVGFYETLTAVENLIYIAKLNGIDRDEAYARIDAALQEMRLSDAANQPVGTFSRGMRQRLGVAEVLIKQPGLIILDEPTQGLDPDAAREFLGIVRRLKAQGITILIASHQLHQLQATCDRVALFHQGRVVLQGTVGELSRQVIGAGYRVHVEASGDGLRRVLEGIEEVTAVEQLQENVYELEALQDVRPQAARVVIGAGGQLLSLGIERPDLDDVYARYFEREATSG